MLLLFASDILIRYRLMNKLFENSKLGVESKQGNGWDIKTRIPRKLISFIMVTEPENSSVQRHEPCLQVNFRRPN